LKKLLGKKDIEDALKRLDTLTTEEARMAIAETLNVTHRVDDKVDKVDDKVDKVDDKVDKVDDAVNRVDNTVNRVDNKVDNVDDKIDKVDDRVDKVDNTVNRVEDKLTVLFDGAQNAFLCYLRIPGLAYHSKRARETPKLALSS
jgi:methyl-accepting chemotaxis protein